MVQFAHNITDLGYDDLSVVTTEIERRYTTPEGNAYPSVTSILSDSGKEGLDKWRARVGMKEANRVSHHAATRGGNAHDACEKYIRNHPWKEFRKVYMPHVMANLMSLKPELDENLDNIQAIETALYSDQLQLAGRVDLVGEWSGKLSIIDFKTSAKFKRQEWIEAYFVQCTAYAIMWEERTGIPIDQIVVLIMVDYNKPQIFVEDKAKWIPVLKKYREEYENKFI